MVKQRQDITSSNCLKDATGKVVVGENRIKNTWKKYMENLMNKETEWDHEVISSVKERPVDHIMIPEVTAALKK